MEFLNLCQAKRNNIKPISVKLDDLDCTVEVLPPFLSHRLKLIQNEQAKDKKMYAFLVVAMCLSEKGVRQIDTLDYEEIVAGLDLLSEADFNTLFTKCQAISKVQMKDVEDAQKN